MMPESPICPKCDERYSGRCASKELAAIGWALIKTIEPATQHPDAYVIATVPCGWVHGGLCERDHRCF